MAPSSVERPGDLVSDDSRATLAAIAARAGVSVPTVSKVLNGRPGVASETRARVQQHLRDAGYGTAGRSRPSEGFVEVLCHDLTNPWVLDLVTALQDVAAQRGLSLVVSALRGRSPDVSWLPQVLHRQPAGVVLILDDLPARVLQQLRVRSIPMVLIDGAGRSQSEIPTVAASNWRAGYVAARHLLDLGHRRITMFGGPDDFVAATARSAGVHAAAETHRDETLVLNNVAGLPLTREAGRETALQVLSVTPRPTGIITSSDEQAIGVYDAARELRLRIPEHLSVVGHDGGQIASWASPPLTTMQQPLDSMAQEALRMLREMRTSTSRPFPRVEVAMTLLVRHSTGAPPEEFAPSCSGPSGC